MIIHLLFSLLEAQEEDLPEGTVDPTKLCGIDYSTASIALARSIGGPSYSYHQCGEAMRARLPWPGKRR